MVMSAQSGSIYLVTTEGKVIQLSNGSWTELQNECNPELRIKRISCSSHSLWAICGDHQVYARLLESDVPIRVKYEAYENERWNPVDGFCSKLLPTDRPIFSSQDGLTSLPLSSIQLPSRAWIWDDQWHLDLLHEGQHLEPEGWMYSVDFPRTFTAKKQWNSCVRRRKWIRNCRFNMIQSWFPLPSVNIHKMLEPFIDVSSGGQHMPGAVSGFVAIWAVTINGLLLFRKGVNLLTCPEGTHWITIETPTGWEPCQVSVSPNGVVWILAWNGQFLARSGVTWDNEFGSGWLEVPPPFQGLTFSHISVGINSAWAVTKDNEVWLRKSIDSTVVGSTWTEMVGKMNLVFTGSDSQVCGLLIQDQKLYLRSGIKAEESGGQLWKMLKSLDMTFTWVAFDCKGFVLRLEDSIDSSMEPWRGTILDRLRQRHELYDKYQEYPTAIESTDWIKTGRALLNDAFIVLNLRCNQTPLLNIGNMRIAAVDITAVRCQPKRSLVIHSLTNAPVKLSFISEEEVEDWAAHLTKVIRTCRNVTGIFTRSTWALSDMGDPFVHESKDISDKSVQDFYEIDLSSDVPRPDLFICDLPSGFYRGCKITICGAVPENANRFSINFQCGSKIHSSEAFANKRDVALHLNPRFEDCTQVVRNSFANGMWDSEEKGGAFKISRGSRFTISVTCKRQHYQISVNDDSISFGHRLSPFSATHLVIKGDVNIFNVSLGVPQNKTVASHALWTQVGGHFRHLESQSSGVIWAIGEDGTVWIHTGFYGGGFFKGLWGNLHGVNPISDDSTVYLYENQRWNPVHGFSSRGLPTDRSSWSDVTGYLANTKEQLSLPNRHWTWISEWLIDYHPPEEADREGWQYATDFPSRYHPSKGSFDYVRRRRWMRKCRLNSTGPWFQFGLTKLLDVSMQVDHSGSIDEPVLLWAIAANGTILRRVGVTALKPQGESWEAILSEHSFQSISIGVDSRVWAVTSLGAPTLRHRVNNENPDGAAWLLLDRPDTNSNLRQISAGNLQVWAIDTHNRLYRRRDIVSILPEGTMWELVDEHVLHVSVGKHDQVWAVLNTIPNHSRGKDKGHICVRRGITASCPAGTGWEVIMEGGWQFVCNRGYDIPYL